MCSWIIVTLTSRRSEHRRKTNEDGGEVKREARLKPSAEKFRFQSRSRPLIHRHDVVRSSAELNGFAKLAICILITKLLFRFWHWIHFFGSPQVDEYGHQSIRNSSISSETPTRIVQRSGAKFVLTYRWSFEGSVNLQPSRRNSSKSSKSQSVLKIVLLF